MDIVDLHRRACEEFGARVHAIGADQWELPTPCPDWSVRDLVGHLVSECRWTAPLLAGKTLEEVGDRFEGDLLGDDPVAAWDSARAEAVRAVAELAAGGGLDRVVHLSFGDHPAHHYIAQLWADHLVHAWDLARAIGADERLDPEQVSELLEWFADQEEFYRAAGAIADRAPIPADADDQQRVLAMFGRDATG